MSNTATADNSAARVACEDAVNALRQARPGMNVATALLLLANVIAIRMANVAARQASDFLRATGDSFAPLAQGKELAEARRLRAAQDFIRAGVLAA